MKDKAAANILSDSNKLCNSNSTLNNKLNNVNVTCEFCNYKCDTTAQLIRHHLRCSNALSYHKNIKIRNEVIQYNNNQINFATWSHVPSDHHNALLNGYPSSLNEEINFLKSMFDAQELHVIDISRTASNSTSTILSGENNMPLNLLNMFNKQDEFIEAHKSTITTRIKLMLPLELPLNSLNHSNIVYLYIDIIVFIQYPYRYPAIFYTLFEKVKTNLTGVETNTQHEFSQTTEQCKSTEILNYMYKYEWLFPNAIKVKQIMTNITEIMHQYSRNGDGYLYNIIECLITGFTEPSILDTIPNDALSKELKNRADSHSPTDLVRVQSNHQSFPQESNAQLSKLKYLLLFCIDKLVFFYFCLLHLESQLSKVINILKSYTKNRPSPESGSVNKQINPYKIFKSIAIHLTYDCLLIDADMLLNYNRESIYKYFHEDPLAHFKSNRSISPMIDKMFGMFELSSNTIALNDYCNKHFTGSLYMFWFPSFYPLVDISYTIDFDQFNKTQNTDDMNNSLDKDEHLLMELENILNSTVHYSYKLGLTQDRLRRYTEEYDQLYLLGEGTFGQVFKIRKKIDLKMYAMKKIILTKKNSSNINQSIVSNGFIVPGYETISINTGTSSFNTYQHESIQEVQTLSLLCHPNIVRYIDSWIELVPVNQTTKFMQSEDSASYDYTSYDYTSSEDSDDLTNSGGDHFFKSNKKVSFSPIDQIVDIPIPKRQAVNLHQSPYLDTSSKNLKSTKMHKVLYIMMELCEWFTLENLIEKNFFTFGNQDHENPELLGYLNIINITFKLVKSLLVAVDYLHDNRTTHRDIKPANVLFSKNQAQNNKNIDTLESQTLNMSISNFHKDYTLKLSDFGLAFLSTDTYVCDIDANNITGKCGSLLYVAPEVLYGDNLKRKDFNKLSYRKIKTKRKRNKYNNLADEYSLGIVIYELFLSLYSYDSRQKLKAIELLKESEYIPAIFTENIYDLLNRSSNNSKSKLCNCIDMLSNVLFQKDLNNQLNQCELNRSGSLMKCTPEYTEDHLIHQILLFNTIIIDIVSKLTLRNPSIRWSCKEVLNHYSKFLHFDKDEIQLGLSLFYKQAIHMQPYILSYFDYYYTFKRDLIRMNSMHPRQDIRELIETKTDTNFLNLLTALLTSDFLDYTNFIYLFHNISQVHACRWIHLALDHCYRYISSLDVLPEEQYLKFESNSHYPHAISHYTSFEYAVTCNGEVNKIAQYPIESALYYVMHYLHLSQTERFSFMLKVQLPFLVNTDHKFAIDTDEVKFTYPLDLINCCIVQPISTSQYTTNNTEETFKEHHIFLFIDKMLETIYMLFEYINSIEFIKSNQKTLFLLQIFSASMTDDILHSIHQFFNPNSNIDIQSNNGIVIPLYTDTQYPNQFINSHHFNSETKEVILLLYFISTSIQFSHVNSILELKLMRSYSTNDPLTYFGYHPYIQNFINWRLILPLNTHYSLLFASGSQLLLYKDHIYNCFYVNNMQKQKYSGNVHTKPKEKDDIYSMKICTFSAMNLLLFCIYAKKLVEPCVNSLFLSHLADTINNTNLSSKYKVDSNIELNAGSNTLKYLSQLNMININSLRNIAINIAAQIVPDHASLDSDYFSLYSFNFNNTSNNCTCEKVFGLSSLLWHYKVTCNYQSIRWKHQSALSSYSTNFKALSELTNLDAVSQYICNLILESAKNNKSVDLNIHCNFDTAKVFSYAKSFTKAVKFNELQEFVINFIAPIVIQKYKKA